MSSSAPGHGPTVAVVGATGAAGATLLRVLEERDFPVAELRPMGSFRSAGRSVDFRGERVKISRVGQQELEGTDIAFFAAGSAVAREFAPLVASGGGVAIDKSSAFRMDPSIPLVVPEVNPEAVDSNEGIISNPNCVAIPLCVALAPLHRAFGLRRIIVSTYQAASGAGRDLVAELAAQTHADSHNESPTHRFYPHVLHGNVIPGGWRMQGLDTEEEVKVREETRRVLGLPELRVSITTVRVPVAVGHSAAVVAEFQRKAPLEEARELLRTAPGVRLVDDPEDDRYPMPRFVAGTDDVQVGRLRPDSGENDSLAFFLAADNLRKGAATNAVQVAELVMEKATAAVA